MDEDKADRGPEYWALQALQYIPDHIFAQDVEGRILVANRAMATCYGHSSIDALIARTVFDLFPADTAKVIRAMELQVIETGKPALDHEHDIFEASGRRRWVKTSRIPLYGNAGEIVGLVCTSRDITESKEAEELLLAQANLLDMIAQSAPIEDIFGKIITVIENHLPAMMAAIHLLSPDGHCLMKPTAPSVPGDVVAALEQPIGHSLVRAMMSAIETGESRIVPDINVDLEFGDPDGLTTFGIRAVWCMPILSIEGKSIGALSLFSRAIATPTALQSDVLAMASHMVSSALERKETEELNRFLASHDYLTGLPNRLRFETSLTEALKTADRTQKRVGLAFFDLDGFKLINDSLGHAAGDALLKNVAERARSSIRAGDVVARLGGDEFVMFINNLSDKDELNARQFQRVRDAISAPSDLNGQTVQVTCSMGVAYFPNDGRDSFTLIANADMAMYRAKQSGRNNIQFFDNGMSNFAEKRLSVQSNLREAVRRSEFVLHYQPQVDLARKRIFAAESLVRWNHPELGLLQPCDFMSTAEETGLIIPLGDWILNEACRQNKGWQDAGLPPIVVSVNVSARQFRESVLVASVAAALATSGLEAKYLELELTESLVMQDGATSTMAELFALGVRLAIDDFGTGYSSLSALKHFPVSRLKIDVSFIRDILNGEKDRAIISAIIAMAQKLQMNVIAEGAETWEQVNLLHALGCNEIQGFFFSKPVGPEELPKWLAGDRCVTWDPAEQGTAMPVLDLASR